MPEVGQGDVQAHARGQGLAALRAAPKEPAPDAKEPKDKQQVWALDLVHGGEARQLTDLPRDVSGLAWSPDGTRVAYAASADGGGWRLVEHDVAFHRLIVGAGGNGILLDVWTSLRVEARTIITALTTYLFCLVRFSMGCGAMFLPPAVTMRSFLRSVIRRNPSASNSPMTPV